MKSKRARDAAQPEGNHADPVEIEAPSKKRKRTNDEDASDLKKPKKDKKDKKEKKDKKHKKESRKERKEKRKVLQDLPEQDDDDNEVLDDNATPAVNGGGEDSSMPDAASQSRAGADSDKSAKRDKKKEKKEKKAKGELQDAHATTTTNGEAENTNITSSASTGDKKKKKQKKEKREKKTAENDSTAANPNANVDADADAAEGDGKNDRHIVFVGNLPFTATAASIKDHFASLSPSSVRCMSDPNSDKPCRGFAFVEFGKVWHMRTCLDKFHHSMFNDGVSPPRRINVELTAGGGGKTKQRQDKIKEKNRKLEENRFKRIEREKTAKDENRANGNTASQQHMEDSIHPSRRGMVSDY